MLLSMCGFMFSCLLGTFPLNRISNVCESTGHMNVSLELVLKSPSLTHSNPREVLGSISVDGELENFLNERQEG